MDYDLIKIRAISFGWELLGLALTLLATMFSSSEFSALVQAHFGDTIISSIILLATSGLIKHLRNIEVIKQHREETLRGEAPYESKPTLI